MFEAETEVQTEDKILASIPAWPRGLNITKRKKHKVTGATDTSTFDHRVSVICRPTQNTQNCYRPIGQQSRKRIACGWPSLQPGDLELWPRDGTSLVGNRVLQDTSAVNRAWTAGDRQIHAAGTIGQVDPSDPGVKRLTSPCDAPVVHLIQPLLCPPTQAPGAVQDSSDPFPGRMADTGCLEIVYFVSQIVRE